MDAPRFKETGRNFSQAIYYYLLLPAPSTQEDPQPQQFCRHDHACSDGNVVHRATDLVKVLWLGWQADTSIHASGVHSRHGG